MYKQIMNHISKDIYPFHMPGHKRNPDFIPPNLLDLDITEIPGMDVLSNPTGIIKALNEKISDFYKTCESFLLVNGSSAGIVAAVCATCTDDSIIVVPRNAHTSVYNAMVISGAMPKYIMPKLTADGLAGGICPTVFDDMPYGATVLVVSPTYEGFVSDIASIAEKVHARGGILIVDEAHGAHFAFSDSFPQSAVGLGADIVVQSLHKTLPAPSQCALLHVCSKNIDIFRVKFHINAMQTSSPSYILMSVCDFMLQKLWQSPKYFESYVRELKKIRAELSCKNEALPLSLLGKDVVGHNGIYDLDISKMLFTSHIQLTAEKIAEILATDSKLQMEMATGRHILAMTTVADTPQAFRRLKVAIDAINQSFSGNIIDMPPCANNFFVPSVALSPRKALAMPSKEVLWEDAYGHISAQLIANYPPGIAIVAPGEYITADIPKQSKTVRIISQDF